MTGPNDGREDVERQGNEGIEREARDDAGQIESEANLSWRDREALLPDSVVEEGDDGSDLVPRSSAGDIERGTDATSTGSEEHDGPIVQE